MSEKMLHGVLNAPVEAGDVIGVLQLQDRAKEASELIIKQEQEIATLKAEIGRKDEALKECKDCAKEFKTGDVGTALLARRIYDVSDQALQTKEE